MYFSLYYGDFLYPVQAMILQLILTKGKMIKKILFPIKVLYSPTLKRMIQPPYFFRYGNSGSSKIDDYYPRWAYSHIVIDNPVQSEENTSSKVLEYTSMEARNYGLKFRFSETVDIDELRGIRFRIYQPANVIGKETWKGTSKAVSQQLGVKLIGRFNSVNDYEQEEGVLLTNSLVDFKEEGAWKTYTFVFSKREYSAAATQLKNGIAGIVILPTYSSGVTLAEGNKYKCYIDDIEIL